MIEVIEGREGEKKGRKGKKIRKIKNEERINKGTRERERALIKAERKEGK